MGTAPFFCGSRSEQDIPIAESDKDDEDKANNPKVEEVDEKTKKKKKTMQEVTHEWELMHKQKSLWMCNPKEVTKEGYTTFCKHIHNDWEDRLTVMQFPVEGQ